MLLNEEGHGGGGGGTGRTIWKFPIGMAPIMIFDCPQGAQVLGAGPDAEGSPSVWFLVDRSKPKVKRGVVMIGTGESLPDWLDASWFIAYGTAPEAGLVTHAFVIPEDKAEEIAKQAGIPG